MRLVIEDEPIEYMILPHDAFAIGGGASKSTADTFDEADIPIVRANSLSHAARMHRQDILHQLLALSSDGTPYLQVHKNCANLIRTIPDLPYSETRREEIDDKAEDHAFDALTYALIVIDDPEHWIVSPNEPDDRRKHTPYQAGPEGTTVGESVDIGKVLRETQQTGRDWRNT